MSDQSGTPPSVTTLEAECTARRRGGKVDLSSPVASGKAAHTVSPEKRAEAGKALRDRVPRAQHGARKKGENSPDPIDILQASDAERLPDLVPIRYGRMLQSPFAFYRGAAGVIAADLASTPNNDPLFLQFKEAVESVMEPYAGKSAYPHHGQRVVMGQRLMQPASDLFLGWVTGPNGKQFYVRQLRDAKIKPLVETFDSELLRIYAKACGWVLARAHARAGDAMTIRGYLGNSGQFGEAIGDFSVNYADQAERDHAALTAAVRRGKIISYQEA